MDSSLVLVMLTTLLGVIAVVCSWAYIREKGREKEYYIMMLLLQSGMIGAFVCGRSCSCSSSSGK